ncbi:unnamed protein product [Sphagnum tenellum]
MVVKTKSPRVLQAQNATMEFLLVNHPLDCPICDKSGECDLQDNSYNHGSPYSRYTEERRAYLDLDMGPVIKKNMNRCIHCTRCIRFGEEIAGIREMVAVKRGNDTEIVTIDGKQLQTEYAGNYADICPTGSLTLKEFRFKKRVWMLRKTPTICEGCSRGCNMEIHQEGNKIYRCLPRENLQINKYWLCDEGRFNYTYVNSEDRIVVPQTNSFTSEKGGSGWLDTSWEAALEHSKRLIEGKKLAVLVGTDLTQEEAALLLQFLPKHLPNSEIFHFGTPGITSTGQDGHADPILKMKSKTGNLNGLEKLGIQGYSKLPSGTQAVLVIRGVMAWVERRGSALMQNRLGPNRLGPLGLFQSIADAIKFIFKEDPVPAHVHPFFYVIAPLVSLVPAFMTFGVIPFASSIQIDGRTIQFQVADLNVGLIYVFAVASLGVYGIMMAGWASNNKYTLLGSLRSSSQMISYELSLGLSVIGMIMICSSLQLGEFVREQGTLLTHLGPLELPSFLQVPKWGVLIQPLGFLIFLVAVFAETNRLPFDLPEGESEIVAGYHLEYGSMKFAMFMMAEYLNMFTASGLLTTLYFGGWHLLPGMGLILEVIQSGVGPGLASEWIRILFEVASFFLKVAFFMWFFVWVRWTLPRFRYDQLMSFGWKVMLPLSLVNILVTGFFIYYGWI